MTFRRLFTADGIHDYFWKAKPVRHGCAAAPAREFDCEQRRSN